MKLSKLAEVLWGCQILWFQRNKMDTTFADGLVSELLDPSGDTVRTMTTRESFLRDALSISYKHTTSSYEFLITT